MCHKNAIEMINTKKSYSVFYSVHFVTFGPVGSRFWGVPFIVDVSEHKPNGPNTMNLVEKWA